MKQLSGILCGMILMTASVSGFAQGDTDKLTERIVSAQAVMNEIMATPDKGIPRGILAGASCVTVIPAYKKGAFVVGAQYGQGVATCRTPNGWSAPVFVQLAGGSFGWQIGGQSTDLVLIAMNQNGMQDMLKNKVKLGADAAASAGPVGRNAQTGTDWAHMVARRDGATAGGRPRMPAMGEAFSVALSCGAGLGGFLVGRGAVLRLRCRSILLDAFEHLGQSGLIHGKKPFAADPLQQAGDGGVIEHEPVVFGGYIDVAEADLLGRQLELGSAVRAFALLDQALLV
jgi:lipid-binding SYLF domain-containing protein